MERFWNKVEKTESCWNWIASTDRKYGHFLFQGKLIKAHRFSFMLENGEIPQGLDVCHHCDNPKCVRPSHLFLGTRSDNMRDMIAKGRCKAPKGEIHWNSILNKQKVLEIRSYIAQGCRPVDIANFLNLNRRLIYKIKTKRLWNHI